MTSYKRAARQHRAATHAVHEASPNNYWRATKASDVVAFNAGAEREFIAWLSSRLETADGQALPYGWVLSNAAFKLNISTETVKRYLLKYTADEAPFKLQESLITLRERNYRRPLPQNNNPAADAQEPDE